MLEDTLGKDQPKTYFYMENIGISHNAISSPQNIGISPDMLEDWLFFLNAKNTQGISCAEHVENWSTGDVVELIFSCCEKFKLSDEVKYIAIEVFDRFLVKHIKDLLQQVQKSKTTAKPLKWGEVEERIHGQLLLRVISSIQLASKLHSHYKNVSPAEVRSFLHGVGFTYSLDSILNSELRILKTLDYRMDIVTPFVYLEVLLHILGYNDPSLDSRQLQKVAVKLLDATYISRDVVYHRLYRVVTGQEEKVVSPEQSDAFRAVKADYMLLTTGIISGAAFIFGSQMYELVSEQLHEITRIKREDIKDFSRVIIDAIVDTPDLKCSCSSVCST